MPDSNIISVVQHRTASCRGLNLLRFQISQKQPMGSMETACLVHCKRRGSNNTTAHRNMCNEKVCVEQYDVKCCVGGQHLLVSISPLSNKIDSQSSSANQNISACLHRSNPGQVGRKRVVLRRQQEKGTLTTAFSCVKIFAVGQALAKSSHVFEMSSVSFGHGNSLLDADVS